MLTQVEKFDALSKLGFEIPQVRLISKSSLPSVYDEWKEKRGALDYDIDGLVFSVNSLATLERLGIFQEKMAPKGQIALKFPAQASIVTIKDIEPSYEGGLFIGLVAIFDPVEIAGAEIRRASLKSYEWMMENNVGIGTVVELVRSGDVIPLLGKVISTLGSTKYQRPTICSFCNAEIIVEGAMLACANLDCPAKVAFQINHFLHRINIKGLAHKSLLEYTKAGVTLLDFVSKDLEGIQNKIISNASISINIWTKIKTGISNC